VARGRNASCGDGEEYKLWGEVGNLAVGIGRNTGFGEGNEYKLWRMQAVS